MGCSCPNLEANRNPLVRLCVLLAEPPFAFAGTTAGVSETPPTGEESDIANPLPYPFYPVEKLICRTHGSVRFCNIDTS